MTDIPSCSFGRNLAWFCKKYTDLLNFFNKNPPLSNQASWTLFIRSNSASMKFLSVLRMQHFETGKWIRLKKAGKHIWKNWCSFVRTLGVEPWLQDITYQKRVWCLTGFTACVRLGRYGQGKKFEIGTVSGAISAVGRTVDLAYERNSKKSQDEETLVPILTQRMEGWRKEDPPTKEKFPVGIDLP